MTHDRKEPRHLNAHCHLELSHLRGAIRPGLSFVEWLQELVRLKRTRRREESSEAVANAIAEMRAAGIGAVLDIDAMGTAPDVLRDHGFPAVVFTEMIEFDPALGAWAVTRALERQEVSLAPPLQAYGLSPHAPYTTTPRLLKAAGAAARRDQQWLCVHAAETPEETEMFVEGRGELCDLLRDRGGIPQTWVAPGVRPIAWLAQHGILGPRTLLAHVNDIDETDLRLIRETGTSCVVCPGTHVYFGRGEFPLRRLLEAGIRTYLGTDSLASNEALDMAREIDLACELAPGVPREAIERLADIRRAKRFLPIPW